MNNMGKKAGQSFVVLLSALSGIANAALVGSGSNLPVPASSDTSHLVGANYTTQTASSHTGSFNNTAANPWQGSFTVTGKLTDHLNAGTSVFDFSGLNAGVLPSASTISLGDFDQSFETVTLQARDQSGNLLSEWLDTPYVMWGSGSFTNNSPGWAWDSINQRYAFDGGTTQQSAAAITLMIGMNNNQDIGSLTVVKAATNSVVSVYAPAEVPVPAAAWLFGASLLSLYGVSRKKQA